MVRKNFTPEQIINKLRESLVKYSPIRLTRHKQAGESLVEAGESRTPRPREATQDILQA